MKINPEKARHAFEANFTDGAETGAALSIWQDGTELLSVAGGWTDRTETTPWHPASRVLCWSATKGPAACTTLLALHKHGIPVTDPVTRIWPEFAAQGKSAITFQQVLTHSAALPAMDNPHVSALDHEAVADALAHQAPLWQPGDGHGYHPRTIGFLMDEIVRRLEDGKTLGQFWKSRIAEPCGIDFHIGVSADIEETIHPIHAPRTAKAPPGEAAFYQALSDPASLQARSFASPGGPIRPSQMNQPEYRRACLPAFGGIGSAHGLGKFYALLAQGGKWEGAQAIPAEVCDQLATPAVDGMDLVFLIPTAYSCGMMVPRQDGGSEHFPNLPGTHGHAGAGGSLGFAVPRLRAAFAYVPNQMEPGILPTRRTTRIVQALFNED